MTKSTFPKVAVLSIWACWLFLVLPRMVVPQLLPLIERDLNLSHGDAALLMSVYMFPYALMQLPAGSLSDRFGKKYFIVLSVFGTCLATIFMAFAKTFDSLLIFRMVSGLMGGMFYAPSTAYVVQSASGRDVGMALGLVFTGGSFANIMISLLINSLRVEEYGWRNFLLLCAVPGAVFTPLLLFLLRGEKVGLTASRESLDSKVFLQGLKNPQFVLLLIYSFVSSLSGWSLMTFLPTFFVLERGFTVAEASRIMMVYYITTAFAGFLSGISTRTLGFRVPGLISTTTLCIVSYTIPLSHSWVTTVLVLVFWGLLGGLAWSAYNALLTELTPKGFQGTFLGLFNLMTFLGGTVGPAVFGKVADTAGFDTFFRLSFFLYTVPLGIAIIIFLFPRFSSGLKAKGLTG